MDIYHSWIYIHILNTKWFIWSIFLFVVIFSFLQPILSWLVFSGRTFRFRK